jgi:hypothetical protein
MIQKSLIFLVLFVILASSLIKAQHHHGHQHTHHDHEEPPSFKYSKQANDAIKAKHNSHGSHGHTHEGHGHDCHGHTHDSHGHTHESHGHAHDDHHHEEVQAQKMKSNTGNLNLSLIGANMYRLSDSCLPYHLQCINILLSSSSS